MSKTTKNAKCSHQHFVSMKRFDNHVIQNSLRSSPSDDSLRAIALAVVVQAVKDASTGHYIRDALDFLFGSRQQLCVDYLEFAGVNPDAFFDSLIREGVI